MDPLISSVFDPIVLVTDPTWQSFICSWAASHAVSTACTEDLHKRQKVVAHSQKTFTNFMADVINSSTKYNFEANSKQAGPAATPTD